MKTLDLSSSTLRRVIDQKIYINHNSSLEALLKGTKNWNKKAEETRKSAIYQQYVLLIRLSSTVYLYQWYELPFSPWRPSFPPIRRRSITSQNS